MKKSILILSVVATTVFASCEKSVNGSGEYVCRCESATYTNYGVGPQYVTSGSTKQGDPNFNNAKQDCMASTECEWLEVQ